MITTRNRYVVNIYQLMSMFEIYHIKIFLNKKFQHPIPFQDRLDLDTMKNCWKNGKMN